jgi:16S rRNA (cytosine967-C5)-methyltransferase
MSESNARSIAAKVLDRVERDGAFAMKVLDAELERGRGLEARERALATELVYGVLRTRVALFDALAAHVPRGLGKVDPFVRNRLLVAAYQLLLLDRIPAFAAVNAAVHEVRATRGARVAGFANAVLRKVAAAEKKLAFGDAVRQSAPSWLWQNLVRDVGESEALALLGVERETPPLSVRMVAGRPIPDWAAQAPRGRVAPTARVIDGNPRSLSGYADGDFVIQEEGSQLVSLALGAKPGDKVLDACAGRGQKASLIAEQVRPGGRLFVADLYPDKLGQLRESFEHLGLEPATAVAVDLTVGLSDLPRDFDRVLVDAPCSGSGTLRRRPEILTRIEPGDPARMGEVASQILRTVSAAVRSGGRVLFSVCSVLEEECEAPLVRVSDLFDPVAFDAPELVELAQGRSQFRLLPREHGTDGYFIASLRRR